MSFSKQSPLSKAEKKRLWLEVKEYCDELRERANINDRQTTFRFQHHPEYIVETFKTLGLRPPKHFRGLIKFYGTFLNKCIALNPPHKKNNSNNTITKSQPQKPIINRNCNYNRADRRQHIPNSYTLHPMNENHLVTPNSNFPKHQTSSSAIIIRTRPQRQPIYLTQQQFQRTHKKRLSEKLPSPTNPLRSLFFNTNQQQHTQHDSTHFTTNCRCIKENSRCTDVQPTDTENTAPSMNYTISIGTVNNNNNNIVYQQQQPHIQNSYLVTNNPGRQQFFNGIPRGLPHCQSNRYMHTYSSSALPCGQHFQLSSAQHSSSATVGVTLPIPTLKDIQSQSSSTTEPMVSIIPHDLFTADNRQVSYSRSKVSSNNNMSNSSSPRESAGYHNANHLSLPTPISIHSNQQSSASLMNNISVTLDSQTYIPRESYSHTHMTNNSNFISPYDYSPYDSQYIPYDFLHGIGHINSTSSILTNCAFGLYTHSQLNSMQFSPSPHRPIYICDDDETEKKSSEVPDLSPQTNVSTESGEPLIVGFHNTGGNAIKYIYKYLHDHVRHGLSLDLDAVASRSPSEKSNGEKLHSTPTTAITSSSNTHASNTPAVLSEASTLSTPQPNNVLSAPEAHNDLTILVILEPCKIFEMLSLYACDKENASSSIKLKSNADKMMVRFEQALNNSYLYLERRTQRCSMVTVFFVGCAILRSNMIDDVCTEWKNIFNKRNNYLLTCANRCRILCEKNGIHFFSFMTSTMSAVVDRRVDDDEMVFEDDDELSYNSAFQFNTHEQISNVIQNEIFSVKKLKM